MIGRAGGMLREIRLVVPGRPAAFGHALLACLAEFGVLDGDCCRLTRSAPDLVRLFPEALADPGRRNIWVYVSNPYGLDLCFVLNEGDASADWSPFFRGHRLPHSAV